MPPCCSDPVRCTPIATAPVVGATDAGFARLTGLTGLTGLCGTVRTVAASDGGPTSCARTAPEPVAGFEDGAAGAARTSTTAATAPRPATPEAARSAVR